MDPAEKRFAKEQQAESLKRLRAKLEKTGALETAQKANQSFLEQLAKNQREGVDVLPEIAQAVAWRNIGVPSTKDVQEKNKKQIEGQFEVKVSESGMVSVVPKRRLNPQELKDFVFEAMKRDPSTSVSELRAQNPDIFPPAFAKPQGPEKRGDAFWTKNTLNDTPYWWWPGSWMKYAKALSDVSRGRFEIMSTGKHKDIDLLPTPPPELTVGELAERMARVESLHDQRAALLEKLRDVEGEMRSLGAEVRNPIPLGIAATMEARKADGARLGFQALGIATLMVGTSALIGAYIFSKRTGVTDLDGFRDWATKNIDSDWYHQRGASLSSAAAAVTPNVSETQVGKIVQKTSASLAGVRERREASRENVVES